jgi:hypothetical protein
VIGGTMAARLAHCSAIKLYASEPAATSAQAAGSLGQRAKAAVGSEASRVNYVSVIRQRSRVETQLRLATWSARRESVKERPIGRI